MVFALTTPIAAFDLFTAFQLWTAASVSCFSLAYWVLAYRQLRSRFEQIVGFILAFTSIATWDLLFEGQSSGFELLPVAISLALLQRSKPFYSGIAAGFALLKPQHIPMSVLPGLCVGRLKFLAGLVISGIFQAIIALVAVGFGNVLNFLRINYLCELTHEYFAHNEPWEMRSFRALLNVLLPDGPVTQIALAAYVLVVIGLVLVWTLIYPKLKLQEPCSFQLLTAISIILLLVFGLHAFDYDYIFMMIPCVCLYSYAVGSVERETTRVRALIRVLVIFYPLMEITIGPIMQALNRHWKTLCCVQQMADLVAVLPIIASAAIALAIEVKLALVKGAHAENV